MMDIERVNGYSDPRFPQEVLHQHGAFLADGVPWAFRVVSDRGGGRKFPLLRRAHHRLL